MKSDTNFGFHLFQVSKKISLPSFLLRLGNKVPIFGVQTPVIEVSEGSGNDAPNYPSAKKTEQKRTCIAWICHVTTAIFVAGFGGLCGFLVVQSIIISRSLLRGSKHDRKRSLPSQA